MSLSIPKLYPITDPVLGGVSHAEQVERFAAGGATFVQLRDKAASPAEFYRAALDAVAAARRLNVSIIINDRLDVALAVGADGVHLGQDDLPPEAARRIAGPDFIIGYSTHTLEQATGADLGPADYVAIGPVFSTSTKENPDPVVGTELVRMVRSRISKPLVAIGGITLARARSVIEAGADSVAVISDLFATALITGRTREFFDELGRE